MNKVTKDNKGFSLVELIVVVLIMGILAVALTPQVLKWVNNSRIATDKALMDSLVSNCQTALTNKAANDDVSKITDASFTIKVLSTAAGADCSLSSGVTNFLNKVAEYSGYGTWTTMDSASDLKAKASGGTITITIYKTGKVTGSYTATNLAEYNSELGE